MREPTVAGRGTVGASEQICFCVPSAMGPDGALDQRGSASVYVKLLSTTRRYSFEFHQPMRSWLKRISRFASRITPGAPSSGSAERTSSTFEDMARAGHYSAIML